MTHAHEGAPAPEAAFAPEEYWKKRRAAGSGALWLDRRQERNGATDSADTAGQLQEASPADAPEAAEPMADTDDQWSDVNAFVAETYGKKKAFVGIRPTAVEAAHAAGIVPPIA